MCVSLSLSVRPIHAQEDYSIEQVNHVVTVLRNGYIVINDTIHLNQTEPALGHFEMGFPYKYGEYLLRCFAHNASNTFQVDLNVPLENRAGFYGVRVDFGLQGAPEVFSVEFVLSSLLLDQGAQNASQYVLGFPEYPSLTESARVCNATIILPSGSTYYSGTTGGTKYGKANLSEFTCSQAEMAFLSTAENLQKADVGELAREVRIGELAESECSDTYFVTNNGTQEISYIDVVLPAQALSASAQDQMGRKIENLTQIDQQVNQYRLVFPLSLGVGKSTRFTINYDLPSNHTVQEGTSSFIFNFSLFENLDYYIQDTSTTFVLPEGSRLLAFQDTSIDNTYQTSTNAFQEKVTVTEQDVISYDRFSVEVGYSYDPLWLSFRPTMWVWALTIVGCALVAFWKKPEAPVQIAAPAVTVRLRPEHLKSFVNSYEEKMKIASEIDSLETRVEKGRIPRRRYKVLRKTLETRLSALAGSLEEVKDRMRTSGGKYSELMRQLEVAETEINEAESSVRSIETRLARGELSLEAYRKLLSDYQGRREKARTAISGILLRLREEIQ
jgi:hypothetical protein